MSAIKSTAAGAKRQRLIDTMQHVPKIKILNWQGESMLSDKKAVLIRDGLIYCKKITAVEKLYEDEDEDGGIVVKRGGYNWVALNRIRIVANSPTYEDIPSSLLEPPAMPFPFILIQFQTYTYVEKMYDAASSIYLHCLVSLRGLIEFLPDSHQQAVDSGESTKEVVSYLLSSDKFYKYLKPYLDEFGISKSAITPYEIVF